MVDSYIQIQAQGLLAPKCKRGNPFYRIIPCFSTTRNAIYGVWNGIMFAASPRYDEYARKFERVLEYDAKHKRWIAADVSICTHIVRLDELGLVRLEHWRFPRPNKTKAKTQRRVMYATVQANHMQFISQKKNCTKVKDVSPFPQVRTESYTGYNDKMTCLNTHLGDEKLGIAGPWNHGNNR